MSTRRPSIDTRLQHPTPDEPDGGRPVVTPIYQTSTYSLPDAETGSQLASIEHPQTFYTRYGSPNVAHVEAMVADLEGAEREIASGSGMSAIASAILSHVRAGDHVVAQWTHYTATLSLFEEWLPRAGIEVTRVDNTDPSAFTEALRDNTRLVYCETPTNPTMTLTDLGAVAAAARSADAISVVDNTFASSFNQQPHRHGIDLVVHSATKYLNGHSDVTAGVVTGSAHLLAPVWEYTRVHGPTLHPMEAWLLARGMKTYTLRMRRHNASALEVATALTDFSAIDTVYYPGLPDHPQHDLACRQMPGGFGGMLSFSLGGDSAPEQFQRAQRLLERVELCEAAVSLGSTETLITHPASLIFAHQSLDQLAAAGVDAGLVRLSVGLESPGDLFDDLARALEP